VKLQRFQDLSQSIDLRSFEQHLVAFAHDLDFGLANAAVVFDQPGSEGLFASVGNMPPGFVATSSSRALSRRDPVLHRLKCQSTPVCYDQNFYVTMAAADLWEMQAEYGYRTGLAVALHLPSQRHFLLGFDREKALPKSEQTLTRMFADLQLLAVYAHDAALRLMSPESELGDRAAQLTSQEIECLKWRGEGKSAWETGVILHLSESRINKICAAAIRKLGCVTTSQAAVKALRSGLLV
jgi:DNA-binding CsgD family transcriptional regulator